MASFTQEMEKNTGLVLYLQQFHAMFIKRALHTLRNKIVIAVQLGVPLFFTIMALIVIKTFPGPQDSPPLNLTTKTLGDNVVVYSVQHSDESEMARRFGTFYQKQFIDEKNTDVIYVNNQTDFIKNPDITKYLLKEGHDDIGAFNLKYLVGADMIEGGPTLNLTAYFNNQAYHTPGITLAVLYNALLHFVTNDSSQYLQVTNHPLPRTVNDIISDETTRETTGFTVAFNIVFGMAFLASSFTLFLIKERATKAKHLQFSSGVNSFTFWSATFTWDMINFLIPAVCLLFALLGFNVEAFVVKDHVAHIALLFILYGFAMLPFMYLCSFLFTVPSTGYVWLTMFNILSGKLFCLFLLLNKKVLQLMTHTCQTRIQPI